MDVPFTEEDHFLHFEDAEQCAAMCDRLLSSPAEANEMRWRNWDYYRATVEPGAQMMGVLNELFLECTESRLLAELEKSRQEGCASQPATADVRKPQSSSRAGVISEPPGPTVKRSAWPNPFE